MMHIILAHGREANLPILRFAELGVTTDTKRVYVGSIDVDGQPYNVELTRFLLEAHINDPKAHPATVITVTNIEGIDAENVQQALEQLGVKVKDGLANTQQNSENIQALTDRVNILEPIVNNNKTQIDALQIIVEELPIANILERLAAVETGLTQVDAVTLNGKTAQQIQDEAQAGSKTYTDTQIATVTTQVNKNTTDITDLKNKDVSQDGEISNLDDRLAALEVDAGNASTLNGKTAQEIHDGAVADAVSQAADSATNLYIRKTEKGNLDGVATLGSDGKVPLSQLPPSAVPEYVEHQFNKGIPGGYVPLDDNAKIPESFLPEITFDGYGVFYPNGTEAEPPSIAVGETVVFANPYPGEPIEIIVEALIDDVWSETGWSTDTSDRARIDADGNIILRNYTLAVESNG